jgi:hypothetical protein
VVSYLHPLHTEDTSTLARHGVHDASEAAAHGSAQTPTFFIAPSVTRQSPFARAPRGAGVH